MKEQVSVDDVNIDNGDVVIPAEYAFICLDCAGHMIMDQRLIIKHEEYDRLKRLDDIYNDMAVFMNHLSEDFIKPRIIIAEDKEVSLNWSDDITSLDIIFTGNHQYSYFGKSEDEKIYGDNINIDDHMPEDIKIFLEPIDERYNKRLKQLDENIKIKISEFKNKPDISCPYVSQKNKNTEIIELLEGLDK